jgi:hypothetical protein
MIERINNNCSSTSDCLTKEKGAKLIPKNIFQLTTKNLKLNDQVYSNIEFLKSNNQTWEYELLNEDRQVEFLKRFASQYLPTYQSFGRGYDAAKMDFFRYVLMQERGGVYLDIKTTFLQPLDYLMAKNDSFVTSHWPYGQDSQFKNWGKHPELSEKGEFINGVIICEAKSRIMSDVIKAVVRNINEYNAFRNGVGGPAVLRLTGPVAYTLAIEQSIYRESLTEIDFFSRGLKFSIFENEKIHLSLSRFHYGRRLNSIIKKGPLMSCAVITYFFFKHRVWVFITRKVTGLRRRLN